jgi:hypothetical protein
MGKEKELSAEQEKFAKKLESAAWGLFSVWVGISFLLKLHMGLGLLGIGVITLGAQVARIAHKLKLEWFWVAIGVIFVLGGIWDMATPAIPLVPILLIIAGAAIFLSHLKGLKKTPEGKDPQTGDSE